MPSIIYVADKMFVVESAAIASAVAEVLVGAVQVAPRGLSYVPVPPDQREQHILVELIQANQLQNCPAAEEPSAFVRAVLDGPTKSRRRTHTGLTTAAMNMRRDPSTN
jgi:hypothetical protein